MQALMANATRKETWLPQNLININARDGGMTAGFALNRFLCDALISNNALLSISIRSREKQCVNPASRGAISGAYDTWL
jgi:hypothetical protein